MNLLIVNFHYYSNKIYSSGIYPISPINFTNQVKALSKTYNFVGQKKVSSWIKNGERPVGNYCLLTFDDGLKQQMNAFNWLMENEVPAIFYVPAKPFVEKTILDVHKLHLIRTKTNDTDLLKVINHSFDIKFSNQNALEAKNQYRYDSVNSQKLKYILNFIIPGKEKKELIDNYFVKIFGNEEEFCNSFYMDENDVKLISNKGMLGNHGYAHMPLATLSINDAKEDVSRSTNYFEKLTQNKLISFSYPYGGKSAVNQCVADIIKTQEYDFGLTMHRGINDSLEQPFLLKRIDTNDAPGGKNNSLQYLPNQLKK
jgi:peptidoglycan/xylan/chitin deacetylase (PgdA/CDA1 family)